MTLEQALDAWCAANHSFRSRVESALKGADREAGGIEVAGTAYDGGVRVVIAADRRLKSLAIAADAYRGYDERSLAAAVVDAVRRTRQAVSQAQLQIVQEELGVRDHGGHR